MAEGQVIYFFGDFLGGVFLPLLVPLELCCCLDYLSLRETSCQEDLFQYEAG